MARLGRSFPQSTTKRSGARSPAADPQLVTPPTRALILTSFILTVTVTANQLVTPGVASLTTATFAPTVSAPDPQTVTPPVVALTLATFAPTVTASNNAPVWTTPADTVQIGDTPELKFTMPSMASAMFFELHLDTANTFNTGDLRDVRSDLDQTGWDFWNGTAWEAVTGTGVPNSYAGNEARYTVQTPLSSETWYRRVRAGV